MSEHKRAFATTVQLPVLAGSSHEADDGVCKLLDAARLPRPNGERFLADWAYLQVGGHSMCPTEHTLGRV